ncbi:uncharacterized protein LOC128892681 isoform X1 [Hylaeus anthracinus]|uniref:uncharacterized protein LOC128892681 isoform X1 n=1 Tax=Hylaeus anthracinus TaxID=313031 RepID=UPI0023B8F08D|nr:uncharacterized protein LOC128892681 isoform X1 [Hylaeus anthracinus]
MLRLNCTSGRSKPAANLTWYINGRQPLESHVRTYSPLDTNESEWQISQIGLQFLLTHEHFTLGKLKIRCSASIYNIYWRSTEVSVEEDRPRVIHYEPAATIVGINYLQPPPNFQTGQQKPDGQVGVKGNDPSTNQRVRLSILVEHEFMFPGGCICVVILISDADTDMRAVSSASSLCC